MFQESFFLFLVLVSNITYLIYDDITYEHKCWSNAIVLCEMSCFINIYLKNMFLQRLSHAVFAGLLSYGIFCTRNISYVFSIFIAVITLITRFLCNRCLFFWWKETREIKWDFFIVLACIYSWFFRISNNVLGVTFFFTTTLASFLIDE